MPAALVQEQEVRVRVVGHEQIHVSVSVQIGRDDALPRAGRPRTPASSPASRNVPVTFVVVQDVILRLLRLRAAVHADPPRLIAAKRVLLPRPLRVVADVQVQQAVFVVVQKRRAGPPAFVGYPRRDLDPRKRAVPLVVQQAIGTEARDVQVGKPSES